MGVDIRIYLLAMLALTSAFAITPAQAQATNVSVLYGYNGSAFVPVQVTADGSLKTNINLSQSLGISPLSNNTYDLGTALLQWANVYVRSIRSTGPALSLFAGGAERVTALAGGYVGINITSPTQTLTVVGDVNATRFMGDASLLTGLQNASVLYGVNESTPTQELAARTTAGGVLKLAVEDASGIGGWTDVGLNVYLVTAGDKVGIGTSAPQQKLEVVGEGNFTGRLFLNGSTWIRGVAYTWPSADGSANQVLQTSGAGVLSWAAVSGTNLSGGGITNRLVKWLNTTHLTNSVITDDGVSIGINASAPNAMLSIRGAPASGLSLNVSDILYVNITSSRVGIGTTDPDRALEAIGDIRARSTGDFSQLLFYRKSTTISGQRVGQISFTGDTGNSVEKSYAAIQGFATDNTSNTVSEGAIAFVTTKNAVNYEGMRIIGNGSVGIGTTSPTQTLNVVGSANVTGTMYAGAIPGNVAGWKLKSYTTGTAVATVTVSSLDLDTDLAYYFVVEIVSLSAQDKPYAQINADATADQGVAGLFADSTPATGSAGAQAQTLILLDGGAGIYSSWGLTLTLYKQQAGPGVTFQSNGMWDGTSTRVSHGSGAGRKNSGTAVTSMKFGLNAGSTATWRIWTLTPKQS